ncbi:hypothetical protein HYU14_07705 [Candidatus Woesearchaeota archaeon]|nr:hypothetical protein [Candidatus Woesearchaeota archaeon]
MPNDESNPPIQEKGRNAEDSLATVPKPELRQLLRFLNGYDHSAGVSEDEPYQLLLRSIKEGHKPPYAASIASFLAHSPDVAFAGWLERKLDDSRPDNPTEYLLIETGEGTYRTPRPDQLLYNLLLFSACLRQPENLAEPLYQMFGRKKLKGDWRGPSLVGALCDALIWNQVDSRLLPEWKLMMDNGIHPYLGGSPFEGFSAIDHMPIGPEKPYQPNVQAVYAALVKMYEHFRKTNNPGGFITVLADIRDHHPGVAWMQEFRKLSQWNDTTWRVNTPIERFFEHK